MNRNLLLFAIFLVVLGIGFDFYLLSLFGLLILIPALMAPSRPLPRTTPEAPRQEARRISPPPKPQPMAAQPAAEVQQQNRMPMYASQPPSQSLSYSPALFPNAIFPTLSLSGSAPQRPPDSPASKQPERDELIEAGALLALLKLFVG